MERVNTTGGVQHPTHVNTVGNTYDVMESLDEDEVLHTVAAPGWYAEFENSADLPLVCWAVRESDKGHEVVVSYSETGQPEIDVSRSVADEEGFVRYRHSEATQEV